jgi:hypothetical protein
MPDLVAVYAELRGILEPLADRLNIKQDDGSQFCLYSRRPQSGGIPPFFGAAQIRKRYVSFHLMPVYTHPELLRPVSAALKARMQGKSCFNFATIDRDLMKELATLTHTGFEHYRQLQLA